MRIAPLWVGLGCLAATSPLPAQDYRHELMVQTGGTLKSIDAQVAMNDAGTVVFTGVDAKGSQAFVSSKPGVFRAVTFAGTNRTFSGAAINDATVPQVATRDRVSGTWLVRKWPAGGSGSNTIVGRSPNNFDSAQHFLDINDEGIVVFPAQTSGSTKSALMAAWLPYGTQAPTRLVEYPGLHFLRPQISDDNRIVIRDASKRIVVVAHPSGKQEVHTAIGPKDFAATGFMPGIAPVGDVVAFWGKRGSHEGIFISVRTKAGLRWARVAGGGCDDFTDFDETQRVGVIASLPVGAMRARTVDVVFAGTRKSVAGIHSVRVMVWESTTNEFFADLARPRRVLGVQDAVGSKRVASVYVSDPLNDRGQVVVRASFTDGTSGVVRSSPEVRKLRRVRLQAKRVIWKDATKTPHAFLTFENLRKVVQRAADILREQAEIELVVDCLFDVRDPRAGQVGSLFDANTVELKGIEAAAKQSPATYGWRSDAINVYFVNSINAGIGWASGVASFPTPLPGKCGRQDHGAREIVLIAPRHSSGGKTPPPDVEDMAVVLAHELGHYFHLFHTQSSCVATESLPVVPDLCDPNGGTNGDQVKDTPKDDSSRSTVQSVYGPGSPFARTHLLGTLLSNLMSYHGPRSTLTPGQVSRMLAALDQYRRHVEVDSKAAATRVLGVGCGAATSPRPQLVVTTPRLDASSCIVVLDAARNTPGAVFLSIPRRPFLMGACAIHVDLATVLWTTKIVTSATGYAATKARWPKAPALVGFLVHMQAAVDSRVGPPPLGLDITNGVELRFGWR